MTPLIIENERNARFVEVTATFFGKQSGLWVGDNPDMLLLVCAA